MDVRRAMLAVLAHPDDETIIGGTLARYAAQGARVVLLTATRGEVGTIFNTALASPENIAQVREEELRCSCEILGIEPPRFMSCSDGAVRDCAEPAVGEVVRAIRSVRPLVVLTWGPDGLYGHPDHVAVHRLATEAWHRAGDPGAFPEHLAEGLEPYQPARLFYAEFTQDMIDVWGQYMDLVVELNGELLPMRGVPEEAITVSIDISEYLGQKMQARACHGTQMSPDSSQEEVPEEVWARLMGTEHFAQGAGRPLLPERDGADLFGGLKCGEGAT